MWGAALHQTASGLDITIRLAMKNSDRDYIKFNKKHPAAWESMTSLGGAGIGGHKSKIRGINSWL